MQTVISTIQFGSRPRRQPRPIRYSFRQGFGDETIIAPRGDRAAAHVVSGAAARRNCTRAQALLCRIPRICSESSESHARAPSSHRRPHTDKTIAPTAIVSSTFSCLHRLRMHTTHAAGSAHRHHDPPYVCSDRGLAQLALTQVLQMDGLISPRDHHTCALWSNQHGTSKRPGR